MSKSCLNHLTSYVTMLNPFTLWLFHIAMGHMAHRNIYIYIYNYCRWPTCWFYQFYQTKWWFSMATLNHQRLNPTFLGRRAATAWLLRASEVPGCRGAWLAWSLWSALESLESLEGVDLRRKSTSDFWFKVNGMIMGFYWFFSGFEWDFIDFLIGLNEISMGFNGILMGFDGMLCIIIQRK